MAKKAYEEQDIQNIANAIREKGETTDKLKVSEMAQAITDLPSGGGDLSEYFTSSASSSLSTASMSPILWHIKKIPDLPMSTFQQNDTTLNQLAFTFSYWGSLEDISVLKKWDVSKITTFNSTFNRCYLIKDLSPIKDWNTGSATNFSSMFSQCKSVEDFSSIYNFNVSKATNLDNVFSNCEKVKKLDLSNWTCSHTSNVSMGSFVYGASVLEELNLKNYVANVSRVSSFFLYCYKLELADIRGLTCSNITSSSYYSNALTSVPKTVKIIVKDATEKAWWQGKYTAYSSCFYTPEEAIAAGIIES